MTEPHDIQSGVNAEAAGVLTNSMVLLVSKALSWVLAFVMIIMLPRYLGVVDYGRLYFAIALTTMMGMLVEFGLNSLVTREVARSPESARSYLLAGSGVKTLLWGVAFAVVAVAMAVLDYPAETKWAVLILGVGVVFTSLGTLVMSVLQALDSMRWVAIGQIVEKAVLTGFGAVVLLAGYGIIAIACVTVLSGLVSLAVYLVGLWRTHRPKAAAGAVPPLTVRLLFLRSLPFFSVVFFGAIYFRVDAIVLSLISGDAAVGWYGAAYKLFEVLNFFPQVLMFAFFPLFSRLSVRDDESFGMVAQKSLDWLLVVGLPIAAGTFVLAGQIVESFYGTENFAPTVLPLRVLAVTVAFLYANSAMVWLLITTERQAKLALTAGVAAGLNVGLNLILIPIMSQNGAAVATLATEIVVLSMNTAFLPSELRKRMRIEPVVKMALAAAAMAVVLVPLAERPLYVTIPLGAAVYAIGIIVLGAIPRCDLAIMKLAMVGLFKTRPKPGEAGV